MSANVDPGIVSLFGGETRVLTLAALSNSTSPLTGYRVTKLTGVQPTKVYEEIRRLANSGIVTKQVTENGRTGWVVSDPYLRSFFRERVRLLSAEGWKRELEARVRQQKPIPLEVLNLDLSRYKANPSGVPNRKEFERPALKDQILAAAGLQVSRHGKLRR